MLKPLDRHRATIDTDYQEWLDGQITLLQARRFDLLDLDDLIGELKYLAGKDRRAIASNLRVIFVHLLKWRHQPDQRSNSGRGSITEHRGRIDEIIENSPSLAAVPAELLEEAIPHRAKTRGG